jgi:hypothetical protein
MESLPYPASPARIRVLAIVSPTGTGRSMHHTTARSRRSWPPSLRRASSLPPHHPSVRAGRRRRHPRAGRRLPCTWAAWWRHRTSMGSHGRPAIQPTPYHAARTVERSPPVSARQVDLDALAAELLAVVEQSVQPVRLPLWLCPPASHRRYRKLLQLPLRRHDNFRVSVVTDQRHCPIRTASELSHLPTAGCRFESCQGHQNVHRRRSDGLGGSSHEGRHSRPGRGLDGELPFATHELGRDEWEAVQAEQPGGRGTTVDPPGPPSCRRQTAAGMRGPWCRLGAYGAVSGTSPRFMTKSPFTRVWVWRN